MSKEGKKINKKNPNTILSNNLSQLLTPRW